MSRRTRKHESAKVLWLDRNFMPMSEGDRRDAMIALSTGRAHALDLRTWERLSVREVAGRPLHAIVFPHTKAVNETRLGFGRGTNSVLKRDGHRCQYVGCEARGTTVDHIVPKCQGGLTTWENLVACCLSCNQRKGGRTPEQAGMVLKKQVRSRRAVLLDKFNSLAASA